MFPAKKEDRVQGVHRRWGEGAATGCGEGKRARGIFHSVPNVSARPSLPETSRNSKGLVLAGSSEVWKETVLTKNPPGECSGHGKETHS